MKEFEQHLFFRRDENTGFLLFSIGFQPDEAGQVEMTDETFIEMCHQLGYTVSNIPKTIITEVKES